MPRTMKTLLLILSVLFSVLLAEGFLRVYFSLRTNYDIEMWKYALQLKQETDDRRSHVHIPGAFAHLMDVDLQINSKGLRDREIPYEKPEGVYRILCLGDSVNFGWGVPFEGIFPRLLETGLNRAPFAFAPSRSVETVNMGVGNYNLEQQIETYLREGRKYHPDAVLLFYHITDAEPTQKHPRGFLAKHSYLYAFLIQRFNQLRPYLERGNNYVEFYQRLYRGPEFEKFKPTLDEMVKVAADDGVKLIPVLLPEIRSLEKYPFREYHDTMTTYFASKGLPTIDLRPDFEGKTSKDFLVAFDDPHPNALGHALIATAVEREIRERKLLP